MVFVFCRSGWKCHRETVQWLVMAKGREIYRYPFGGRNVFSHNKLRISPLIRFMTDAARREQETMKKKATPKLSLSITGGVSRNSTATPPRHTSGNLTPPVTPPITPSSSFRSSTPTGRTGVNRVFWGGGGEQGNCLVNGRMKPAEANESPFHQELAHQIQTA